MCGNKMLVRVSVKECWGAMKWDMVWPSTARGGASTDGEPLKWEITSTRGASRVEIYVEALLALGKVTFLIRPKTPYICHFVHIKRLFLHYEDGLGDRSLMGLTLFLFC